MRCHFWGLMFHCPCCLNILDHNKLFTEYAVNFNGGTGHHRNV